MEKLAHHRRQLNCTACHTRDGLGKPDTERNSLFTTTGNDLGDEGRLPPLITGVGAKLTETALHKVLRGEDSIRPYMTTRMPDFGEAHAKFLVQHLTTTDARAGVKATARDGRENEVGRNQYGRELLGTKGVNCITCHQLGGYKSLGIRRWIWQAHPNAFVLNGSEITSLTPLSSGPVPVCPPFGQMVKP